MNIEGVYGCRSRENYVSQILDVMRINFSATQNKNNKISVHMLANRKVFTTRLMNRT